MADQASVFDKPVEPKEDQPLVTPEQEPITPVVDNNVETLLSSIVNEDGKPKYKTLDDAIKALKHSQEFIPQLQSEVSQFKTESETLKAQVEKFGTVEEVVNRLTALQNQSELKPDDNQHVSGLDEKAVGELFQKMLNESRTVDQAASNEKSVNDALVAKYGDKASEVVAEKAKELGATSEEIRVLASQKPAMVLALFNTVKDKIVVPTTNSVRSTLSATPTPGLDRPEKSLLGGSTSKQQAAYMRKIRDHVYAKHGVTTN